MIALLLALQLVTPVDYAYAGTVGKDVVVSVTYTDRKPDRVCTRLYAEEDALLLNQLDAHCWTPDNAIANFDVWKDRTLASMGTILVAIFYSDKTTYMVLQALDS